VKLLKTANTDIVICQHQVGFKLPS